MRRGGWALLLVCAALAVRLAAADMALAADRGNLLPDEARYLEASRDLRGLMARWGEPGFALPPGFPCLLAAERRVWDDLSWLRLCGALLGAASCLALVPLARSALPDGWPSRGIGWAAAWGAALSPLCAASSAWILSESLYTPLLVLAVWALARAARGSPAGALAGGVLLAGSQLVRPLALPIAVAALGWLVLAGRRREACAVLLGLALVALGLGAGLGAGRAARVALPLSRVAQALAQGWSSPHASGYGVGGVDLPARAEGVEGPVAAARLAARKVLGLWRIAPRTRQLKGGWPARLSAAAWVLTYPAALVGLLLALRGWRTAGMLALLPAVTTATHALTITSLRYRLPLEPFLVVLAAWGGWAAWRRLRSRAGIAVGIHAAIPARLL